MELKLLPIFITILSTISSSFCEKIRLPSFKKLKLHYPGYKHYGGRFTHKRIKERIGCDTTNLLYDTSALRLSFALNKIGGADSIGTTPVHLSKYGKDSIAGKDGLQYLYHPIAFGPYFADKYGYPNISILHQKDPTATKEKFWGKQGVMEIITYTKHGNKPKGHMALWDCDHIHQAKDWISKHTLITVEFWESPDSECSKASQTDGDKASERHLKLKKKHTTYYKRINTMRTHIKKPNYVGTDLKTAQKVDAKVLKRHLKVKKKHTMYNNRINTAKKDVKNDTEKPTYVRTVRLVADEKYQKPEIRYDTFRKAAYDRAFKQMRPVYSYEKRFPKKPRSNVVVFS